MNKDILIVHFNTPELTSALVKSINKFTPGCNINIFDNSDSRPFPETPGVTIWDNTNGQLLDFESILDKYPDKLSTRNNYASSKHMMSVDYMFDVLTGGFVLMDSDILLKKDISLFFNPDVICSGHVMVRPCCPPKLAPFICGINVPICKQCGIHYFDENRSWRLNNNVQYDTGGSFLEDCKNTNFDIQYVDIWDYIIHLWRGSWRDDNEWMVWLKRYEYLYN